MGGPKSGLGILDGKGYGEVGDSITLRGNEDEQMQVTVLEVVDPAESGDEFMKPSEGNRFIAVRIRFRNVGPGPYSDSPSNGASVVDRQDQSYDASIFDEVKPALGSARIAPDDQRVGFITFEVPEQVRLRKLQITLNSGFGPETGEWTL